MSIIQSLIVAEEKFNGNASQLGIPNTKADGSVLNGAVSAVFITVGSLALLFLLIGALRYVISRGNEERIKAAKDTIRYSLFGLVIAITAFLIVEFIVDRIA